jgi:hypothetical protein
MTAKIPKLEISTDPPAGLGRVGLRLWCELTTEFADWLPSDLALLAAACLARQEIDDLTSEIQDCTDFKQARQLRADRNAAATTMRQCLRELNLAAAPPDSRPGRIPGRYSGNA